MKPHPDRRALLLAAALLLAPRTLGCAAPPSEESPPIHLVVLHTSDVHGQCCPRGATWVDRENPPPIGGLPRVAAYVRQVREELTGPREGLLVVDAGDWYQGTPEGLLGKGRDFLRAMAEVGYDVMCVGNHDLDHGVEHLERLLADVELPTVLANVWRGDEPVGWGPPWRVIEVAGLRIAVVGLLTPTTPEITHEDARALRFEDPAAALARVRAEVEDDVDWILPLTHLGVPEDRELARAHPDLPIILGGHSHTYLAEGLTEGEVLICHVGSKGSAVGRTDLLFDGRTRELLEVRYQVVDLFDPPAPEYRNEAVEELCAALIERSEVEMSRVVGRLDAPLGRNLGRYVSSPAGNLVADVMRERLGADVAIQNRGGLRRDLSPGPVTRRDLFELLPFGNHLVCMTLTGAELAACLSAAIEGTAHTGLEFSGLVAEVTVDAAGNGELARLLVGGAPVDPEGEYRVVTNSFLAGGGDAYPGLSGGRDRREDPAPLRAVLEEHFRARDSVRPPTEDRYRVVEGR